MKLNLGSGECPLDGYVNMDAKNHASLFPLYRREYAANESPAIHGAIADDCADEVRASHVLEHFPHGQTLDVLREWVRVLKPGGWLKIAVPDFGWIATAATQPGKIETEYAKYWPMYLMGGQVDENDFHRSVFTHADLYGTLMAAGLVNIQPWTSEIQDCASLPVSLNLMGQKPEVAKMTDEHQAQVKKNLQALASIINNDTSTFAAPKREIDKIARTQVFAAGRWQDLDGEVQCATQEEVDAANRGELQTRTIVVGERRAARVALCLSTPRIGFLRPLERLLGVMHQAGVSVFSGDGVFWHHSLSRSIKNACDFYFEDSGEGFDFILTADYDTYALPEDLKAIVELLARNPQADCIASMQMKRGGTGEILAGGSNMNLTAPLVPIETGHFGFTLFRKEFFEKLPTPWFYEKPDVNGHWGDGRIDSDIGFWLNAKKAKLNVMLAPGIVVGHGEELITYPRIISGKPQKVYQAVNDWLGARTKPEGIGVQM